MCTAEIAGDQMTLRVLLLSHIIRFLVCTMYIPGKPLILLRGILGLTLPWNHVCL
jgi:hypothetical protein